jgi:hypothetical protein
VVAGWQGLRIQGRLRAGLTRSLGPTGGSLGDGGIAVGRRFLNENGDRRVGAGHGQGRIIRPHWGSLFLSPARFADDQGSESGGFRRLLLRRG